ncbi:protein SanA, affects membrane permeability for vancomycin [Actinopolyspora xinjiangensis]|uniref:Protein SanA, affects membrane permeability for vancomycin n=1 Tax=Actinopolyspora xinjiangensis TaxID=405564 RepID=A0A1H0UD15_9ACTN|nr:YdcF family protein [Actinopolyspora xinjiangensis]SDP63905.1 protein SanA, affects membrane permeability for vancomycin [Actinopolyspora xinjiangensis]
MSHPPESAQPGRRGRAAVWARRTVLGALLVASLVLGGTAFRVWQVALVDQRHSADMIVVLGAAQYNGDPSPVLRGRLEHALELYRDGRSEHIVTVGGNQRGDNYTEAQASRIWLVEHGVPERDVFEAEFGSDTLRSIRAVSELAGRHDWNSALIVSDPWHSWRCRTMAEDQGLRAMVSPTRSGPTGEVRTAYILREAAAMLFYRVMHASADITGYGLD